MHRLKVTIFTREPVILSMLAGDANMVASREYFSGSTVRGLVAARILSRNNIPAESAHGDERFHTCILDEQVLFMNAYISGEDRTYHPLAKAWQEYKGGQESKMFNVLLFEPDSDKATTHKRAFVSKTGSNYYSCEVATELHFHHQREREKGISREGFLFNYESVSAGQMFSGELRGSKAALEKLIDLTGTSWTGYAGRSRTAQYGKVEIELEDKPDPIIGTPVQGSEVMLTLLSDTIVYNDCGFPSTDVADFAAKLGTGIKLIEAAAITDTAVTESYVSKWGLKRPSEKVIAAGSCFLLDTSQAKEELLLQLVSMGIGERRQEGFGQCRLESQIETDSSLLELSEEVVARPENDPPEKLREYLQQRVDREMEVLVITLAQKHADDTCQRPSNALLGRLQRIISERPWKDIVWDINLLRDSAKKQLQRCYTGEGNRSLYDQLGGFKLPATALDEIGKKAASDFPKFKMSKTESNNKLWRWDQIYAKIAKNFEELGYKKKVDTDKKKRQDRSLQEIKDIVRTELLPQSPYRLSDTLLHTLQKFCDETGCRLKDTSGQGDGQLNRLYLSTLLTALRKNANQEGGK